MCLSRHSSPLVSLYLEGVRGSTDAAAAWREKVFEGDSNEMQSVSQMVKLILDMDMSVK